MCVRGSVNVHGMNPWRAPLLLLAEKRLGGGGTTVGVWKVLGNIL